MHFANCDNQQELQKIWSKWFIQRIIERRGRWGSWQNQQMAQQETKRGYSRGMYGCLEALVGAPMVTNG